MFYLFGALGSERMVPTPMASVAVADSPYLVALALCEQGGKRLMPLSGRSQRVVAEVGDVPEELGHALALELLLRVWQRSDEAALSRAAGPSSLLLVELPMDALPERLPALKADWLTSGDTEACLVALKEIALRAWSMSVAKFQPITLTPLWCVQALAAKE